MQRFEQDFIMLAHGDGGKLTHKLVNSLFRKYFTSKKLAVLSDAAIIDQGEQRLAFTTDTFVIQPLFFPGGDIGKLAICGTVNDMAVSGAVPKYLAVSFVIEEGLKLSILEKLVSSMAKVCQQAGVEIVAGDTKVVERGQADKIFITTTGIGWLAADVNLGYQQVTPGDLVVVNGTLADHGIAILAQRHQLDMGHQVLSDCAPLNDVITQLLHHCPGIKLMRDLTRGGLATAAKEIALAAGVDIWLTEANVPVKPMVEGVAQILGLDPLYIANEGKFLAIIDANTVEIALEILRNHPDGKTAVVVGQVKAGNGDLYMHTKLGGTKVLDLLMGIPLPRIC